MDISIPFRFDEAGKLAVTTDVVSDYSNKIKSILGTAPGERLMRPGYGSDLITLQFDYTGNDSRSSMIRHAARRALKQHLPELEIEIKTEEIDNGSGMPGINVAVSFSTDLKDQGTTTVQVISGDISG